MSMTLSGNGTITGLTEGGLPNAVIDQANISENVTGSGPCFSAYLSAQASVANNAYFKALLNSVEFDTASAFDTVNSRFKPTVAGYYRVSGAIDFGNSGLTFAAVHLYKNGTIKIQGGRVTSPSTGELLVTVSGLFYMNGTTDYMELWGYVTGTTTVVYGSSAQTYMHGELVRAA